MLAALWVRIIVRSGTVSRRSKILSYWQGSIMRSKDPPAASSFLKLSLTIYSSYGFLVNVLSMAFIGVFSS